ncbi:MAG: hypothetical protein ACUVSX_10250 [Aggregatilineales bacterium]
MEIVFNEADAALAARIQRDLETCPDLAASGALVVIASAAALSDPTVRRRIETARDRGELVVPVLAEAAPLPRLIEHIAPVDFTKGYDFAALAECLRAPAAPLQMKVLTPAARAANRRAAVVFAVLALIMFALGLYGVGVLGLQAPTQEYNQVETEIILTRNGYIEAALPRSTDDALNFQATVNAARPTLRPLLIATATALAGGADG